MKIASFALAIFALCITAYCYSKIHDEKTDYCKLVTRLQNQHAQEMQSEGYVLERTGGELCNDVEKIYVGFYSRKALTIDEVRKDYVKGVERFLTRINNDEPIRPYLHTYPFGVENLKYIMSFNESPVDSSGKGPVVHAFSCRGNIYYSVYDPTLTPLKTVHKEPYSEALRIVRESGLLPDENAHTVSK
jgi:hypothetical protein